MEFVKRNKKKQNLYEVQCANSVLDFSVPVKIYV